MANRDYAANQSKLQRAVSKATEEAKRTGAEVSEERIKELYISFAGLLNDEVETEETRGSAEGEETRPRSRSRRSSKDEE